MTTWLLRAPNGVVTEFALRSGSEGLGLFYRVVHNGRDRWMLYRLVTSREAADALLLERGYVAP